MLRSMSSFSQRRSTASARLRENQAGPSSSTRGQKTIFPDTPGEDKPPRSSETHVVRKKKGPAHPHAGASASGPGASLCPARPMTIVADGPGEQNRKSTFRPFSRSCEAEVQAMLETRSRRQRGRSKRRDRSASRDAANRSSARLNHTQVVDDQRCLGGNNAGEDLHKLREELEAMKQVGVKLTPKRYRAYKYTASIFIQEDNREAEQGAHSL
jgi:hypothetical protein